MGMQRKSSRKGELKWRQTDWYWYDGTSLDFVNWGELQPNSDSNSCAVVMKITGLWDDRDCTGLYRFICKTGAGFLSCNTDYMFYVLPCWVSFDKSCVRKT